MDSLAADIEQLNSRLFLLARDPVLGVEALRLLNAEPDVIARITAANEAGIRTAVRCGVPLVAFADDIDALIRSPPVERRTCETQLITTRLRNLTTFALQVAQRLALQNDTMAGMHFGLQSAAAEALTQRAITDLESMSRCDRVLLRLRKGDQPLIWDRFLIGRLSSKAWAFRVSHDAALLSLGAE